MFQFNISNHISKNIIFAQIAEKLVSMDFNITKQDSQRPWGGFFVIDETQTEKFASTFFSELVLDEISITQKLSPKILVVAPQMRLSWQYHFRRAEVWKVIGENLVGVKKSFSDLEPAALELYQTNQLITLQQGERHRLIGLENWGVIAEIWQHTDASFPSDESDIIRLQDDFGR